MNAIEVITEHVTALGPSRVLDKVVPDPSEITFAFEVVESRRGFNAVEVCRDVPVWAVVSLGRRDFLRPGDTWAAAGTERLTDHWPLHCLDYLESPLYLAYLNQGNAGGYLELRSVGGAVTCSNANHRLAAAIAWLVAKDKDDNAVLNQVQITIAGVDDKAIEHMLQLWRAGWKLSYRRDLDEGAYHIKATGRYGRARVFKRKESGFAHEMWLHPILDWWRQPKNFYVDPEMWKPFPQCILEAWDRRGEWDGWNGEGEAVSVDGLAERLIAQKHADALTWCRARAAEHVDRLRRKEGELWHQVADAIEARV